MPFLLPAAATAVAAAAPAAAASAAAATTGATLTSIATNIAMNVAISAVMSAIQPQVGMAGRSSEWTLSPDGPIPFAAGRIGVPGAAVHRATFGPDLMYLGVPSVLSGAGPIDGYESFKADDEAVEFDANGKAVTSQYAGELWFRRTLGTQPDVAVASPPGLKNNVTLSDWTPAHKLSGKAAYMVVMGENSKGSAFPTGEIKPLITLRGLKGWDPRLDSTWPGGVGPCRLDDPSTWVYLRRPGLWALKWSLGLWEGPTHKGAPAHGSTTDYQVGGIGAKLSGIDVQAFITLENICDANDWTVSAYPTTDDDKHAVLTSFLQAGGAIYATRAGKISCIQRAAPRTSVVTIGANDTAGPLEIDTAASRIDRINTIRPRIMSENHRWQLTAITEVSADAYRAEDGGTRPRGIDYTYVDQATQGAQLAGLQVANTREGIAGIIPLKPHLQKIKPGDAFTITEPGFVLNGLKCLCLSTDFDPTTKIVAVSFVSETDAKYPFALGQSQEPPEAQVLTPVDYRFVSPPGAGDWTVTPRPPVTGGGLPGFDLSGVVNNATASAIIVEFGTSAVGPWTQAYQGPPTVTNIPLVGVDPGEVYYVAISYQRGSNYSDRQVYGPYTAPALVAGDVLPTSPTVIAINAQIDDLIETYGDTVAAEASAAAAAAAASAATAARDVTMTARDAASASASAASGSASSASSSATAAGTSASNANASYIAADSARASAVVAQNAATTSATNAAGSATTATTAAGVATTARDAAGASATAASGSASSAASSATAAGTSASAAQADRIAAQTANTNAGIARDAAVAAQTGAAGSQAAAATSATLAARVGLGGGFFINSLPSFAGYSQSAGSYPPGWENWNNGTNHTTVNGQISDKAVRWTVGAVDTGMKQDSQTSGSFKGPPGPGWWVLEAQITRDSGALTGAGVLLQAYTGSTSANEDKTIVFSTTPDSTDAVVGAGANGKTYAFSTLFKLNTASINRFALYMMPNWSVFGASTAKTITFDLVGVRRATAAEIETGVARSSFGTVSARISAEESARASADVALAARATTTEALARYLPNKLVNSDFSAGGRGWTSNNPAGVSYYKDANVGSLALLGGSTNYIYSDFFEVAGGSVVNLSANGDGGSNPASALIYLQEFTGTLAAPGAYLGNSTTNMNLGAANWTVRGGVDITLRASTTLARVLFDRGTSSYAAATRIMVATGTGPIAWNDQSTSRDFAARTSITETSVADAQAKLAIARIALRAAASGSDPAYMEIVSGTYGSNIALVAQQIALASTVGGTVVPVLVLSAGRAQFTGNVDISGNLIVGGSIDGRTKVQRDTITPTAATFTSGTVSIPGTTTTVVAEQIITTVGGPVLFNFNSLIKMRHDPAGSFDMVVTCYAQTLIGGNWTNAGTVSVETASGAGNTADNIIGKWPVSALITFLGAGTHKILVAFWVSVGNMSQSDVTNRFTAATELRTNN